MESRLATDSGAVPTIQWLDDGKAFEAQWRSYSGMPPATRVVVADGKMTADEAYGLACQGTALLWRGDFQEARQMLSALGNRSDRRQRRSRKSSTVGSAEAFHLYRQARSQRARTLNALLIAQRRLHDSVATSARYPTSLHGGLRSREDCISHFTASVARCDRCARVAHERHRPSGSRRPNSSSLRCLRADSP